jgi:hypothetical protein
MCEDKPLATQINAVQSPIEVRQEISRLLFVWNSKILYNIRRSREFTLF